MKESIFNSVAVRRLQASSEGKKQHFQDNFYSIRIFTRISYISVV